MKKTLSLIATLFILNGCAETLALLGPASSGFSGGKMAQSAVSSAISYGVKKQTGMSPTQHAFAYVKEHNLQNPQDKRQIKPDKKLKKLLKYEHNPDAPLTYYRLQTYMKPHFTKKDD